MSGESLSSNMSMPLPGVGVTTGPTWAQDLNDSLTIVDQHDHSPGSGVPVTPNGLNINQDLSFINNNAINLRSARFLAQSSPLSLSSDLGCLYVSGVDLYYNDENGNQIRLTQSGGVAGSPGSISNLISPASASYVAGSQTFVWQSAANTPANMDFASAILRNLTANSKGLTLAPPAAMAADYTITLPALPASTLPMQISALGIISTGQITTAQITDLNVTTAKINDGAVTTAKIADANVTTAKINDLAVITEKLNDGAVTTAKITDQSITVDKLGAPVTGSSGIINVTVTATGITTLGVCGIVRPSNRNILVSVQGTLGTGSQFISGSAGSSILITRNGTVIANFPIQTTLASYVFVDNGAGVTTSLTYQLQLNQSSGTSIVNNMQLLVSVL